MVFTAQSSSENIKDAINFAKYPSEESLARLADLSPSLRNSEKVYYELGQTTGDRAKMVVDYIRGQCVKEDEVLLRALGALRAINTHEAEILIKDIALNTPAQSKHAGYIGAECIVALQYMGTPAAAEHIVEIGQTKNDLLLQALTSLGELNNQSPAHFSSAYKSMCEYATQRENLLHILERAADSDDLPLLRNAFLDADQRQIMDEPWHCSTAFELAVREAEIQNELKDLDIRWRRLER